MRPGCSSRAASITQGRRQRCRSPPPRGKAPSHRPRPLEAVRAADVDSFYVQVAGGDGDSAFRLRRRIHQSSAPTAALIGKKGSSTPTTIRITLNSATTPVPTSKTKWPNPGRVSSVSTCTYAVFQGNRLLPTDKSATHRLRYDSVHLTGTRQPQRSAALRPVQLKLPNAEGSGNPFAQACVQLGVSQQELATLLNTSHYAIARWERGDIAAPKDILERISSLLSPEANNGSDLEALSQSTDFQSTNIRSDRTKFIPNSDHQLTLLSEPRKSLLSELWDGEMWLDSQDDLTNILLDRDKPAPTSDNPLSDEIISAGKNTYTYDAHTYHTKVPPQGIANVIQQYLPHGGIVLDPFAGSGMTGVAARYLGYDVVLNEISPAASFISHNFIGSIDSDTFTSSVSQLIESLEEVRKLLCFTDCRECGKEVEYLHVVWSYVLECNHCGGDFLLWEHCREYGENLRQHKLLRKFPCPHCKAEVNKSQLARVSSEPVFVIYRCCSKQTVQHPLNDNDLQRIQRAGDLLSEDTEFIPKHDLPDGANLNQPRRHGLDSIHKFYTDRNLFICSLIWHQIRRVDDPIVASYLGFTFTSLYKRVTRLSEYRFWGGSSNTANFNVPHIFNESNVFLTFERKAKSIADHLLSTAIHYRGRRVIRTGSATDLNFLPDNSIDFIFTDPPFGANINYSEMNLLWEAWLGSFTATDAEAIVSKHQGKSVEDYQGLITKSLSESFRVLRPNHWMVLVFMNSSDKIWNALREAIEASGFSIEKLSIFDKQHGTFKQFVSENTSGADLMIHCKKRVADVSPQNRYISSKAEVECVTSFCQQIGSDIPLLPYLHVDRSSEVDYRTLFSKYVAQSIRHCTSIVEFPEFRRLASKALKHYVYP